MVDDEQDPNYGKFNINVGTTREKIYYEIGVGDSININIAGGDLFSSGGNAANPGSGVARSDINDITFPVTITAPDNAIDVTVNGINVTTTIPAVAYNTAGLLADAIKNAVNASPLLPAGPNQGIEVSISNNILEISTQAKSATSTVTFNNSAGFFNSIGATPPVLTTGATGDSPAMIQLFNDVIADMDAGNHKQISDFLDVFDAQIGNVLRCRADVGARQNRVDLSTDRMSMDEVNFTDLLSKNEDVDIAETIMNLKNEENVYQASLAGGARIIQQTLVDFLR
jgi:flagellar hook-associated protein 3 FlgL